MITGEKWSRLIIKKMGEVEIWKPIKGYYDYYSISTFGRVRNDKTGHITTKLNLDKDGYSRSGLSKNGEYKKTIKRHRLVGIAFLPNPNKYPEINHINQYGPRSNNNITNLQWATNNINALSINRTTNIGNIRQITKKCWAASIQFNKKRHYFYAETETLCKEWLNRREYEIRNNLPLTEIGVKKRNCRNNINPTKNGKFLVSIQINKIPYRSTFDTQEEAEKYLSKCKLENINKNNN